MWNSFSKNTWREITNSVGRFLAILAITAIGVGFFCGLKSTKKDMIATADRYLNESCFFDWQGISTLGWTQEDAAAVEALDYVRRCVGMKTSDFLCSELDGGVIRALTITDALNEPELRYGRIPEEADECLADPLFFSEKDIGRKISLSEDNSVNTFDAFSQRSFTIVGIASSPLYMSYERGTSSIGSGSVFTFILIPESGFNLDYYTSLYVLMDGTEGEAFSEEYADQAQEHKDDLTDFLKQRASIRYTDLCNEITEKIADAETELEDGWAEYDDGVEQLEQKWLEYYDSKATVKKQLDEARQQIVDAEAQIEQSRHDLEAAEAELSVNSKKINSFISQLESAFSSYGIDYSDYDKARSQIDQAHSHGAIDSDTYMMLISNLDQLYALYGQRTMIAAKQSEVEQGWYSWNHAVEEVHSAYEEYDSARQSAADEFSRALAELTNADEDLKLAKEDLDSGQRELDEARAKLADIKPADVFILDRSTVAGYYTFDSNSEIVEGISRVFPIFFFSVAALICSTTMNRMVVEQRTQIGTFKALGYSRAKITGKYLLYSGLASTAGWGIGFFAGSWLFPTVIWKTYCIMYHFSDTIEVFYDPALALLSLAVSLICSLGVTYLTCRSALSEVPAELMRPKAPDKGGRLALERLSFVWNRLSFMTKVSLRNIVRYKKRLLMMILGVSGCTALLITGFGLGDSIKPIVDSQYNEITLYDISVSFTKDMAGSDAAFAAEASFPADSAVYICNMNTDITVAGVTRSCYIIASNSDLDGFVSLHNENGPIAFPNNGEAVITSGLAETLSLREGDTFSFLDQNQCKITLTVSGICTNYVYNYVYMNTSSFREQTGADAELKTALILSGDEDPHVLGARISKCDCVQSVSVSDDLVQTVDNMMSAMDYIVLVVILSAAALAFTVLYNLTNINIKEREREIATIKVLGFYPAETANYIFRENLILAVVGALLGLPLGRWLHQYVMGNIRLDMIYFPIRVAAGSIYKSIGMTILFAVLVNLVMIFRLNRINMADSMKSVE